MTATFRDLSAADRRRVGMLTHFALDKLFYVGPDSAPDGYQPPPGRRADYQGCCPQCCGPCVALKELHDAGQLDQWVLGWPDLLHAASWWDDHRQRVDRDWLHRSWANADELACHEV